VVAYLTGRLSLSQRDTVEAMQTLHGVELSLGSVSALQRQVSAALAAPVETARQYVRQQWTNYVDETGWKEQARQCWLWLNSTRLVTAFQISRRRDQRTARQVIGRVKTSIITTDRHNVYSWLGNERRQLCWAHLKRDFQAVAERGGESQRIGRGLLRCTKEVFDLWHQSKVEVLGRVEWQEKMQRVSGRVKRWLERGGECGQRKTRGLCRRLLALERALWTFVRVEGVEPTNNQAERGLRRAVLWRRKSFGTQSREGSRFVERVLTAVTSLRQQGRDVLEYLTALCQPQGNNERPICLLPDTS
jgi:transposase